MPRRNWTESRGCSYTRTRTQTRYTNVVEDWQTNSEQAVKRTRSWRISWRATRRATPSHDWVIRHGKRTTWRGEPTMHLTIHSRHRRFHLFPLPSSLFPLSSFLFPLSFHRDWTQLDWIRLETILFDSTPIYRAAVLSFSSTWSTTSPLQTNEIQSGCFLFQQTFSADF